MMDVELKHRCQLPFIYGTGDIWQCDDCGRAWRSHAPGNPEYNRWTRYRFWFWRRR